MPVTNTDAILWYNVGEFGKAGYAVPNWSNDIGSLNPSILDIVSLMGKNLFHIMHHEDVDMRVPPSINTLKRIHRLFVRFSAILNGRMIPYNEDNLEIKHVRPAGETFLVYPCPYFKVRNMYMKRWANLIMVAISEAMQHTENRKEMEISPSFAGQVGQYLKRVYQNMAVEMFGKTHADVIDPAFILKDEDFAAYDPTQWFTSTEMVDTVPRLDRVFTEDRLELLAEGIPISELPPCKPWPVNLSDYYSATRNDGNAEESQLQVDKSNAVGTVGSIPKVIA